MHNIIQKLLPTLAGDGAAARIADLKARHQAAAQTVDQARQAYEGAVQSAVAGEATMADVAKAKDKLTVAEDAAALLASASELAEQQHAKAQAAAVVDQAWATTLKNSKDREVIADRLQKLLAQVAATYAELRASSAEVHRSLPVGFPSHAAAGFGIEADLAPSLVRVEYSRRGLPGGPNLMWGDEFQLLADRYKAATRCIEHARAQSWEAANLG